MSQRYTRFMVLPGGKILPVNTGARPFASCKIEQGLSHRYQTLQERFARYLIENGLSQAEFTRCMKKAAWRDKLTLDQHWVSFSQSTTSAWFNGRFCPSEARFALICKYTGVPKEWFLGYVPLNSVNYKDNTTQIYDLREDRAA